MLTTLRTWMLHHSRCRRGECVDCGRSCVLSRFDTSGTHKDVTVHVKDLPCHSCGEPTHAKRYVTSNFGADLMDVLYFAGQGHFPTSRLKRFGAQQHCYACGKRMPAGPNHAGRVSGVVMVKESPQFMLDIAGPLLTCEGCGREQIHCTREVASRINDALIAAFDQIGLQPR